MDPEYPPACITVDWSCNPEVRDSVDAEVILTRERAELFAQAAIRVLTGNMVGACPIKVRPCLSSCSGDVIALTGGPWMTPFIRDGRWYNSCGCRHDECSCSALTHVLLEGPVGEVIEVLVDGVAQATTDYRVDNGNELVRLGGDEWPSCQSMSAPTSGAGSEGTMEVTYIRGAKLDALGQFVAGLLANDFLNACNGGECSLPSGVTSLSRQGVSIQVGPELFPNGRTGIDAVDLWVESWNPYKAKAPARIYSPDHRGHRQTTWAG